MSTTGSHAATPRFAAPGSRSTSLTSRTSRPARPARPVRLRETWPFSWRDIGMLALSYVVMAAALVAIGLPLRHASEDHGIGGLDHRVATWLADHRNTTVNTVTWVGSTLANTYVKIGVTAIIVLVMLRVWHRWFEAAYVAIALILEATTFITVTMIVRRPRPDVPHLGESRVVSSFPSGHVAAAVVYGAIAVVVFWHTTRRAPRVIATVLAILVPIFVGFSRVQRGLHNLSDVIAGILLGIASLVVTTLIALRAQERLEDRLDARRALDPPPPPPDPINP